MIEKSAKEVKGFLLYQHGVDEATFVFRVYDAEDKRKFVDYDLAAEDIELTIDSDVLSLYDNGDRSRLDWSSKYLNRN